MASELVAFMRRRDMLVINRRNLRSITLPPSTGASFWQAFDTSDLSSWHRDAMNELGLSRYASEDLICRMPTAHDIRRIAWEVTTRCNFRCVHCYLDNKTQGGLPLADRLLLLKKFERMGCLWLQLTGGEVLADPLFAETYRAAWNEGLMLSISTNGTLLSKWIDLFNNMPPRRVTVSFYGASNETYCRMTKASADNFDIVIAGLDEARAAGIRLRLAIIATKENAHEISKMERLAQDRGIEFHTYYRLSPTLDGNKSPMEYMVDEVPRKGPSPQVSACGGGTLSVHMNHAGHVSPCKLLSNISFDLKSRDISEVRKIAIHPGTGAATPHCSGCSSRANCTTCAPVLNLYRRAMHVPRGICRYYADG